MSKTINREELLKQLESVTPGLSPTGIVEQSDCFIFLKGKVITFNDEIACSIECSLRVTGAVPAEPLLDLLRKLPEDDLEISTGQNKLIIKGKRKLGRINMDPDISLPFKSVGEPKKWVKLPDDFLDGVKEVQRCAGKDEQKLEVYVHVHPERIEACTGTEKVGHWRTHTDIKKPVLIHSNSIKHVPSLGMIEIGVGDVWTHFRNPNGLVLSCRWIVEDTFPDTSRALAIKGTKIQLPKGLADAAERAGIFSDENIENNDVSITIKSSKVIVMGTGASGDFRETKTVKYHGPDMSFMINPQQLQDIVTKHHEAWVNSDALKVKKGKFTLVLALDRMADEASHQEEEETDENPD